MAETESETKLCANCKKQISANNFVMHEMHCRRHISLCKHCQEPIPRNEMDIHYEENHTMMKCPKCKIDVEKMHFEDHEENDCKKKPMHCLYCELEFPKDELESHLDYCGSRTEPCVKCGQFIMLREQIKHDESNCTYPEVKPKTNNVTDDIRRNPYEDYTRMIDEHNIFTGAEFNVSDAAYGATRSRGQHVPASRQPLRTKNKKPDVNKKTDNSPNGETEYDRLLAMHLAQDLGQQNEDFDDIVQSFDKLTTSSKQYGTNALSNDSVMIPCEFCGQQVSVDDLVQHQSGCSLDRISAMLPQMSSNNQSDTRNNISPVNDGHPAQPSIIDNLREFRPNEWYDDTAVPTGYDIPPSNSDDMLLPCEFCCDLFPMESLVQHQAMCDRMTMTPLPPTPPEERRSKPTTRSSNNNSTRLTNEFPNLSYDMKHSSSSQKRLNTGSLNINSDDDGGARAAHTVQKPKPKSTVKNGIKPEVTTAGREIRSTLRKYGVETVDRGDDYTRQGSLSRQGSESTAETWQLPSSTQPQKRTSSNKTRSTLDNLLSESDHRSSHDLLGHIGGSQSSKRETNLGVRQKVAVQPGVTARGTTKVKTSTTAKDVQREMSRLPNSSNHSNGVPPRTSTRPTRPGFEVRVRPAEADETSDIVTGQRRGVRANNVFGASTNKTTTTRRSSNR